MRATSAAAGAAADPSAAGADRQRAGLHERIEALKARKASLPEGEYLSQLEALLVQLARVSGAARSTTRP